MPLVNNWLISYDHEGIFWTIDNSGNVHNIRKSSECLIKFQLFLKASVSRTKTLESNIIVKGRLV